MTPASPPPRAEVPTATRGPRRTTVVSIVAAAVLVALKLGAGLITGSLGLISAGIESSGDVIAAVLTFFAVRLGSRPADDDHPYGHRRAENLAALGEAGVLIAGGGIVTYEAIDRLAGGGEPFVARWYVFAVIGVALLIDLSRVTVSLRTAVRYHSAALRSNAFHFGGDLLGSLAVLAGLIAVSAGLPGGDAIASLVVAGIIFAAATRLIRENARVLMDTMPADAQATAARAITALGPDVELSRLRLRESGGRYFADAVVAVPPGQAIVEGHATADHIEAAIRDALPGSDVVVHVEPRRHGLNLRDRVLAAALSEPLVHEAHDVALYEHDGTVSVSLHLKLPAELPLDQAHAVAERIERGLLERHTIDAVQTHLEPLERPLTAEVRRGRDQFDDDERERVRDLVRERTGAPPRTLRVLHTDAGLVLFVTVAVAPSATLPEAHALASRIEDDIRRRQSAIYEVVVHTEP